MDVDLIKALAPYAASIAAILGTILLYVREQRRYSDSALSQANEAWERFVGPLQERVSELEAENKRNRQDIRRLRSEVEYLSGEYKRVVAGVAMLTNQVVAAGLEPVFRYTIPERKED